MVTQGKVFALAVLLYGLVTVIYGDFQPLAFAQEEEIQVLVFSKTAGFRHASISDGIELIETSGEERGWEVDSTEDANAFTDANLANYDVVVWLSTTGDVLNNDQQAAFERFIQNGGGYAGVHAATDTEYGWPWYGDLVGAYFSNHPQQQNATLVRESATHPSTAFLPERWTIFDEWYNFDRNPRPNVDVLLTLDESTYSGGSMGDDHPIAWAHEYDGGRSWYTAAGHRSELYTDAEYLDFQRHVIEGIAWAASGQSAQATETPIPTATSPITATPTLSASTTPSTIPTRTPDPNATPTPTPTLPVGIDFFHFLPFYK